MKLLILGGTSDAKTLATTLHDSGIMLIYSIAGIVRQPNLPCEIISGGFSKHGGLTKYIRDNGITALLNATHPFAEKMSQTAARSAEQTGISYWRYQRPDWQETDQDSWQFFKDWTSLLRELRPYQSTFLSQGQLSESMLAALIMQRKSPQQFVHRTAIQPTHTMRDWMTWVQAIGPFTLGDEITLLEKHQIEVIVSKHSGGELPAKLLAARRLKIPVMLLDRPAVTDLKHHYNNFPDLIAAIQQQT